MTAPDPGRAAYEARLDPTAIRRAIIAAMPKNVPLRGRMARAIMADVVAPLLSDLRAAEAELAAIRRPLGVTPDSGAEFYDPRMAEEAEARRAEGSIQP